MILIADMNSDITSLRQMLDGAGVEMNVCEQDGELEIRLFGDIYRLDRERLQVFPGVRLVLGREDPYYRVRRSVHPQDSIIPAGGVTVGGGTFRTIAGPCSVESEEQLFSVAEKVKAAGASILRGGAYKPRTSPYTFQGLGKEGIRILVSVGKALSMPVVTEIMDASRLDDYADVDVIQVGARSMQNFVLLHALGETDKPILLKRGYGATLTDLLLSAEHIACAGNEKIILCERGIRTFSGDTRNTLDLSAVPLLREKTHLPVLVDPSHGTGLRRLVPPMAMAAAVVGADGVMVEVHSDPDHALCDGQQSISTEEFAALQQSIAAVLPHRYRETY